MSASESRHFRTHTIRFMKREGGEERRCRSLVERIQNKRHFYCGSLLQMVKFYENERRRRLKTPDPLLHTLLHPPDRNNPKTNDQQPDENRRFPQFATIAAERSAREEPRTHLRLRETLRSTSSRKQQQRLQFGKLVNDLSTKTKEILSRKEALSCLRRSREREKKGESTAEQPGLNFYQFRTRRSFKQTLSTKQESEDLDINYPITPW